MSIPSNVEATYNTASEYTLVTTHTTTQIEAQYGFLSTSAKRGRACFGWNFQPHQSFKAPPTQRSKGISSRQDLKYSGKNSASVLPYTAGVQCIGY